MAKMIFGMNLSLDGYVDHERFAPGPSPSTTGSARFLSTVGAITPRASLGSTRRRPYLSA